MARYNTVQIGSTYLTQNGLSGGKPCKVNVTGLPAMKTDKSGQVIVSANGTPYAQVVNVSKKGLVVEILTDWCDKTVFDTIVTAINSAINGGTSLAITVNGDTGNFSFNAIPRLPDTITFEGFSGGIVKGAGFRFITT